MKQGEEIKLSSGLFTIVEQKAKSEGRSFHQEVERLIKIALHFDTNLSPEFLEKAMKIGSVDGEPEKNWEFHETVATGQRLFNAMVAQYGKAIHKESSNVDVNMSLVKVYQNNIEVLKDTSRSLINLPEKQVINTTKKFSVIYKANLQNDMNGTPLSSSFN